MKIYVSLSLVAACAALLCSCKKEEPSAPSRKGVTVLDQGVTDAAQSAFDKRQAELAKKKTDKKK